MIRDECVNKLLKLLMKVKKNVTNNNNNLENLDTLININGINKTPTMENEMVNEGNEIEDEEIISNATLQILFKGAIKKLYDIPIYIFRFRDILDNEEGYKSDNPQNNEKEVNNVNTFQSKKSTRGYVSLKSQAGLNLNTFSTNQRYSSFKNFGNMFSTQSSISSLDNKINNLEAINQASKFGKKSKEYKKAVENILKKKSNDKKLEHSSIILMMICFGLSIFNVAYQLIRVNRVQIITSFYIQISYLKDKTSYLQSGLLTEMYEFGNYSDMDITTEEMFDYLKLSINSLQEAISSFYKELIKYDRKIGKNCMGRIYGNFTKIVKIWDNLTYESDIFRELYYAIYLTNIAVKEDTPENIGLDVNYYFFNKYREYLRHEV